MKKKLITGLSIASLALFLVGCGTSAAEITSSEKDKLNNFSFNNKEYENAYLSQFEIDDDMMIDGEFTESAWENNGTEWYFDHYMSSTEMPVNMTTMSYYGENGVYIAFSVTDRAIYYSDDRTAAYNSSVEIYITDSTTTEWTGNTFRISVAPTGDNECITEMWTYRPKFGWYTIEEQNAETGEVLKGEELQAGWRRWYQPHIAACKIRGEGGINSANNEGYDVELFIPYESFALTETPELMQYMTAFNHVETDSTDAARQWTSCYKTAYNNKIGSWLLASNDDIGTFVEMTNKLDATVETTDTAITMDGDLSEDVWADCTPYVQSATRPAEGIDAMLTWKTYFSDEGLYIGTDVLTNDVYAVASRNVKLNTGLEFWVQSVDQETITADTVQLRIDATGNVEKYRINLNNEFIRTYFTSKSVVKLNGCTATNGVVSSSSAEGFSVETFIPWEELGLSAKPEQIAVFPQYAQALDTQTFELGDTEAENAYVSSTSPTFQFFTVDAVTQIAAKEHSQRWFVTFNAADYVNGTLDGKISENEYTGKMTYGVTTSSFNNGAADIDVYWTADDEAVYLAFDVSEYSEKAKYLTNTGSGNQGTAGVNFFVKNKNATDTQGYYYRAYASGLVRYKELSGMLETTSYPGEARPLDYVAGSHSVAAGARVENITDYVIEFKITYASVGAQSLDDLSFVFGWITSGGVDTVYDWKNNATYWTDGSDNSKRLNVINSENYWTSLVDQGTIDGVISANEYTSTMSYSPSTSNAETMGTANVNVHYKADEDAIYLAFEVTETGATKYLTHTGSGNQGTAGVNFLIKNNTVTSGYKGYYYRAWASGIVRYKDLSKIGTDTTYYPGNPMLLNNVAGSHSVAVGDSTTDDAIISYVIEFKVTYESVGATSADDLSFAFGWITATGEDRVYERTTTNTAALSAASLNDLSKEAIWYTYAQLKETKAS